MINAFGSTCYALNVGVRPYRGVGGSGKGGARAGSRSPPELDEDGCSLVVSAAEFIQGGSNASGKLDAGKASSCGPDRSLSSADSMHVSIALFTWPSAIMMSCFLAANPESVRGRRVLEIGAGTGLPSAVARLLGASIVCASDRNEAFAMDLLQETFRLNGIDNGFLVKPLCWKSVTYDTINDIVKDNFEVILGSDVLYSTEDFDDVLGLVATLLESAAHFQGNIASSINCASPVFYTVYQDRSSRRSLRPYLDKYKLKAEVIPTAQFMKGDESDGDIDGGEDGDIDDSGSTSDVSAAARSDASASDKTSERPRRRCSCAQLTSSITSIAKRDVNEFESYGNSSIINTFAPNEDLYLIKVTLM